MFTRPTNLLIGKDISRTVALVDGAAMDVVEANVLEGEVLVLDKYFKVAAAAITYTDSDVIYIAEGSADTYDYVNEAGTAVSGARRLIVSDTIEGKRVISYLGDVYAAKTEQVTTIAAITDTVVAGTEYVLRLIYDDLVEHPGQFTHTYRYIAKTGDASQDVFNGLRARIAKHSGARVLASGTTTLILTGRAIPEYTSKVDSIDEFDMVRFSTVFNYVDSDYNWETVGTATDIAIVPASQGSGIWENVRDVEKLTSGYRGTTSLTQFPVIKPELRTVKNAEYNLITIEHDKGYASPDNQYNKETKLTTMIAINGINANQGFDIQTRLNSWMGSLPQGFTALAVFTNV